MTNSLTELKEMYVDIGPSFSVTPIKQTTCYNNNDNNNDNNAFSKHTKPHINKIL